MEKYTKQAYALLIQGWEIVTVFIEENDKKNNVNELFKASKQIAILAAKTALKNLCPSNGNKKNYFEKVIEEIEKTDSLELIFLDTIKQLVKKED